MQYHTNFPIANSFNLPVKAGEVWFPESTSDLDKVRDKFVLAGATNVVLPPFLPSVVSLRRMPKKIKRHDNKVVVDTNVSTQVFVREMIRQGVVGIEGLWGMPGTIGGAVVGNAGSGRYCISDFLTSVRTLDRTYQKEELEFSRRSSLFRGSTDDVLVECVFEFNYGTPDQQEIHRAQKHRRLLPKDPSAGGIFSNWHSLIPYSNQLVGMRAGGAEVSSYVNIIINKGDASFHDIIRLIGNIRKIVKESLTCEVKIVE